METIGTPLYWTGFAAVVIAMLALDLGVFHRRAHTVTAREAATWSCVWVAVSLIFNALVLWRAGAQAGQAFLTGYIIEKALSVDNLFVFYVIFSAFRVPDACQHRLLFWGIVGALGLRAGMVFGGSWLLGRFQFLFYVFGGVLILTGLKMFRRQHDDMRPEEGRVFRVLRKIIPTTAAPVGCSLLAREGGASGLASGMLKATPLLLVLLLIEATDIVFALDSILAIFAVTTDPFIVLTSNVFAVMGMRSLYFLLASLARRFVYLQPGLALVLLFVGGKMALSGVIHIPVLMSLLVVALLLGGSVVASLIRTRREGDSH
jgi:tellurite resistance protein TerC